MTDCEGPGSSSQTPDHGWAPDSTAVGYSVPRGPATAVGPPCWAARGPQAVTGSPEEDLPNPPGMLLAAAHTPRGTGSGTILRSETLNLDSDPKEKVFM